MKEVGTGRLRRWAQGDEGGGHWEMKEVGTGR